MDQEKTGRFIQQIRKERGMTQQELAEKLMLSNKTISKWETGNGMPDLEMFLPLCKALEISVNELLSGEKLSADEYSKKAEENMVTLLKKNAETKKSRAMQIVFGGILCVLALILLSFNIGNPFLGWFIDWPTLLLIAISCMTVVVFAGAKSRLEICKTVKKAVVPIGAILSLASGVSLLGGLSDLSKIGPNMAVILLSLFYSFLIFVIMLPICARLEKM